MVISLIGRSVRSFGHHFRKRWAFFAFLSISCFLIGSLLVLFRALESNRETYFAQRFTGFATIAKSSYSDFRTKYPPRDEYLFDPGPVRKVLDGLHLRYSIRLRCQAFLYRDDPESFELTNPRSILVIGADPQSEQALMSGLDLKGRTPLAGRNEGLLLADTSAGDSVGADYIVQRITRFGFPLDEKVKVVGTLSVQGANAWLYGTMLVVPRDTATALMGLEGDVASDIILGHVNWLQRFVLSRRLGPEYRLIRYEDADDIAQTVALVSRGLEYLLVFFVLSVLVSAMINNVTISVINRSSEIATFRIFGYRDGMIAFLFCVEYGLMALAAGGVGSCLVIGFCSLFNSLGVRAININLEMAFAGPEVVLQPLLGSAFAALGLVLFLLLIITVVQVRRFMSERRLLSMSR